MRNLFAALVVVLVFAGPCACQEDCSFAGKRCMYKLVGCVPSGFRGEGLSSFPFQCSLDVTRRLSSNIAFGVNLDFPLNPPTYPFGGGATMKFFPLGIGFIRQGNKASLSSSIKPWLGGGASYLGWVEPRQISFGMHLATGVAIPLDGLSGIGCEIRYFFGDYPNSLSFAFCFGHMF